MGIFLACICTCSAIQPCAYMLGIHLCLGVGRCLVHAEVHGTCVRMHNATLHLVKDGNVMKLDFSHNRGFSAFPFFYNSQ